MLYKRKKQHFTVRCIMIKHFLKKLWTAESYVDFHSSRLVSLLGLMFGGFLGIQSFWFLLGKPSSAAAPVPQTAAQVSSAETEAKAMARFLEGLPELERALDSWFLLYAAQTENSVWFLSDKAAPALNPSAASLLGCTVEDPAAEFPKCRGNVYSFYELQCNDQSCSWTLCRHNEKPYSCTYSMNGYRNRFGRWEYHCNVIFPQARAFCKYLNREKDFIINE